MKLSHLRFLFCLASMTLLVACGAPAPGPSAEAPAPTSAPTALETPLPETTATPAEEPFQLPQARLLVYTNLAGGEGGEYKVVRLPDLTVEPYEPLNSEEWFVDWSHVLSPGGHYLAYDRSTNKDYARKSLYLLNTLTGDSTRIKADYHSSNGIPTWTSDGRFLEFDSGSQGFSIYDVQTGKTRHVAVDSGLTGSSAISPTGDRIAYKGGCPGPLIACPVDLYMVNSDGTGEQLLEQGAMDWIFWSADGRLIYYSLFGDRETYGQSGHLADSGYRLYSLEPETGLSSTVDDPLFNAEAHSSAFQSPDGLFLAYAFGNVGLKVVRTTDHTLVDLLQPGDPAWSPDSRYIAVSSWSGEWYLFDLHRAQSVPLEVNLEYSTIVGWLP
jgi:WD40-like Beta Propeller Repeat